MANSMQTALTLLPILLKFTLLIKAISTSTPKVSIIEAAKYTYYLMATSLIKGSHAISATTPADTTHKIRYIRPWFLAFFLANHS
jgi:hypothetical protein